MPRHSVVRALYIISTALPRVAAGFVLARSMYSVMDIRPVSLAVSYAVSGMKSIPGL